MRRRTILIGLLVLLALALPGWWIYAQLRVWGHFRAAEAALARDDPRAARQHLEACVAAWPSSGQVRFLAAQAARRAGKWSEADRRLGEAAERGWVPEALDLERALLRAQAGELPAVENYLRYCLENGHPDSVLILEVLTPIYVQRLDVARGGDCVDRWLELQPGSVAAWRYRAILSEKRQARAAAVDAYRKVIEIGPARTGDRESLARLLLVLNKPGEARPLLEELVREEEDGRKARRLLAQCYQALGQDDEARTLLVGVLRAAPDDAEALHLLGRLELEAGRPERAAGHLRQAARLQPYDREVLYTWHRCLRAVGPAEEAARCEERLKQVEADLERVRDLGKEVMARPDDPEPRRQIGEIFLRNEQEQEGLRWLQSALASRPDHPGTHLSLARFYERKGDQGRAARHYREAKGGQPMPP